LRAGNVRMAQLNLRALEHASAALDNTPIKGTVIINMRPDERRKILNGGEPPSEGERCELLLRRGKKRKIKRARFLREERRIYRPFDPIDSDDYEEIVSWFFCRGGAEEPEFYFLGSPEKFREISSVLPGGQRMPCILREPLSGSSLEIMRGKAWEALREVARSVDRRPLIVDRPLIIEDTSLDIEGVDWPGTMVKHRLSALPDLIGRRATVRCVIGKIQGSQGRECLFLWQGEVRGNIVAPRGNGGFGFDRFFLPDGKEKTLAECKKLSPRKIALQAMANEPGRRSIPREWKGEWQP